MKRIIYILSFLIFVSGSLKAQQNLLYQAISEHKIGNLEKASKLIEEASQNSGTLKEPKTWYYKGLINKDLYKSKETSGSYTEIRNTAITAYIHCIELDIKDEYKEDSRKAITYLSSSIYNDAAKEMNKENYKAAFINFENYLDFRSKTEPGISDTLAIFHAGYTAYMDKNYSKAIFYLTKANDLKYQDPLLFYFLGKSYWNTFEISKAENTFISGIRNYPFNKKLSHILINLYQETGKDAELVNLLLKETEHDPKNTEYKLLLGAAYERLTISDTIRKKEYNIKAREIYSELLKQQPDNFKVNYNLALLYYNEAVDRINQLDYDTDMIALDDIQQECKDLFKLALPYMEKAYQLSPKNKETLKGLQGIYFSLHDIESSNKIKLELEALEKN
jgi:hypothetical protein